MKLLIASLFPTDPNKPSGGQQEVTSNLVSGLQSYPDIEVDVVTAEGDVLEPVVRQLNGARIHYLPSPPRRLIPRVLRDASTIGKKLRDLQPDLIHVHTIGYAYAALQTDYPVVMTFHSLVRKEACYYPNLNGKVRGVLEAFLEKWVLQRLNYIITIASYLEQDLRPRTQARIYRIPLAVGERFFSLPEPEVPNRLLCAGKIIPRKGLEILIQSLDVLSKEIPDFSLHLIGKPDPDTVEYYEMLMAMVNDRSLSDRVHFLGHVDDAQLLKEYADCSVFVHSAWEEGTPTVILQAMAAAKPIVTTESGGTSDIVTQGQEGFMVPVGDSFALGTQVQRLLTDQKLRRKMGEAGRDRAVREHHPKEVIRKTVDIYREITCIDV
jgi:glycosyltransferase involved in cell wall biosynthesis